MDAARKIKGIYLQRTYAHFVWHIMLHGVRRGYAITPMARWLLWRHRTIAPVIAKLTTISRHSLFLSRLPY